MITQTLAILYDAYRDLQSRKMFWMVIILNILAMSVFSLFGANDHALTFLWYEPFRRFLGPVDYKILYSNVVVGIWFTWIATMLALISTAGIFPDLMTSGSIDLYLARPISRLRLFFTKYLAGLLFVLLQVAIFATMSFFALGIRGGLWEPGLFLAIPIILLFFSYLFALCTLFGVWTRSTIASLLLTGLVWAVIFGADLGERNASQFLLMMNLQHDALTSQIESLDTQLAGPPAQSLTPEERTRVDEWRKSLVTQRDAIVVPDLLANAQTVLYDVKSFLPKTRETLALLDRFLFQDKDLQQSAKIKKDVDLTTLANQAAPPAPRPGADPFRGRGRGGPGGPGGPMGNLSSTLLQSQIDRDRPLWWIVGTSLLCEALCLALAARHFSTRDF